MTDAGSRNASGFGQANDGYGWPRGIVTRKGKETDMEPWVWVVIAIAAVLFLLLLFRGRSGGGRRVIVRRPAGPRRRRRWI